jgi:hypothetical protein
MGRGFCVFIEGEVLAVARRSLPPNGPAMRLGAWLAATAVALFVAVGLPGTAAAAEACPNEEIREQQGSTFLPDCRAWEMVSPVDKNGYDTRRATGTIKGSLNGNAVTYAAFGGITSEGEGTSGTIPRFLSRRTENGWTTESVNAPQGAYHHYTGVGGFYYLHLSADFAPDLSKSALLSWEMPLSPDLTEPLKFRWNLFLRDHDTKSYQLLNKASDGPTPPGIGQISLIEIPTVEAFTPDMSHIVFQTPQNLTPEATGFLNYKTYEWHNGEVRLVGILPNGNPAPGGSSPGAGTDSLTPGQGYTSNDLIHHKAISEDGSRIFFTALPHDSDGRLFMRENGGTPDARTVWISESEATVPQAPRPARFRDATPDGKKVFFTTSERLLDEDTDDAVDLYRWDYEEDPDTGHHLTLISRDEEPADGIGSDTQGVLGVGRDGERVYFVARSQLVPGEPAEVNVHKGPHLYLWESGELRYLHRFGGDDDGTNPNPGALNGVESRNWGQVGNDNKPSMVSDDGRYLLFQTYEEVIDVFNENHEKCIIDQYWIPRCSQLYVFDAEAQPGNEFVCVSCPKDGSAPAGHTETRVNDGLLNTGYDRTQPRRLVVDDGHVKVFFDTPTPLDPRDSNGEIDVYVYDFDKGKAELLSSGKDTAPAFFLDANANGDTVFIGTFARLVGADRDSLFDVYAVRVNGGFEEQVASPECRGEECRDHELDPKDVEMETPGADVGVPSQSSRPNVRILKSRARGKRVILRVRVPGPGRVVVTGKGIRRRAIPVRRGGSLQVPLWLSPPALRQLKSGSRIRVRARVEFRSVTGDVAARSTSVLLRQRGNK